MPNYIWILIAAGIGLIDLMLITSYITGTVKKIKRAQVNKEIKAEMTEMFDELETLVDFLEEAEKESEHE